MDVESLNRHSQNKSAKGVKILKHKKISFLLINDSGKVILSADAIFESRKAFSHQVHIERQKISI
jgi:hypothetical protein